MKLDQHARQRLLEALNLNGWTIESDFVYAPRRTLWFLISDPWQGDLADMLERMQARLLRIVNIASTYPNPTSSQDAVDDTEDLINILRTLQPR